MNFLRSISGPTWLVLAAIVGSFAVLLFATRHIGEGEDRSPIDDADPAP